VFCDRVETVIASLPKVGVEAEGVRERKRPNNLIFFYAFLLLTFELLNISTALFSLILFFLNLNLSFLLLSDVGCELSSHSFYSFTF